MFKTNKLYPKDTSTWEKVTFWVTELTMIAALVYILIRLITTTEGAEAVASQYSLTLLQTIIGLVIIHIPWFIERRVKIIIPSFMNILFLVFLFCSICLGEFGNFYYRIPYWDNILHFMSAVMIAALAFSLINAFFENKIEGIHPVFVMIFTICFAMTIEVVWEFYEFGVDYFLGMTMQKFVTEDGTLLIGQAALADTMVDLIVGFAGSVLASLVGYLSLTKKNILIRKLILRKEV